MEDGHIADNNVAVHSACTSRFQLHFDTVSRIRNHPSFWWCHPWMASTTSYERVHRRLSQRSLGALTQPEHRKRHSQAR